MAGVPDDASPEGPRAPGDVPARRAGVLTVPLVAVLVVALVVGAGLVAALLARSGAGPDARPGPSATLDPTGPPSAPSVNPSQERREALEGLLAQRAEAVLDRDAAAWAATVDSSSVDFARRQAEVFANLADVPLAEWRYEVAGEESALPTERMVALGEGAWLARVVLEYRLEGVDAGEVRREQYLTVVRRDGRWLLADDTDGPTADDLWDLGPVSVHRSARALLLGTVPAGDLAARAGEVDDAAQRVDAVWGREWPRTVAVVVPADQAQMARLLQREDETGLDQIAAVTTGELGVDAPGTQADRVIINPAGFAQLGPLGRQVVLTHELTHVATRATTTKDVPVWLSEGFADYVAYRDTGLAPEAVAQDVLDEVRAGRGPTVLPADDDFDPAQHDIAPAYSSAWTAADLVARRAGEEGLVELYRAVSAGESVDEALQRLVGMDTAGFTAQWRAHLEELAR
jgi:hypothetical protein